MPLNQASLLYHILRGADCRLCNKSKVSATKSLLTRREIWQNAGMGSAGRGGMAESLQSKICPGRSSRRVPKRATDVCGPSGSLSVIRNREDDGVPRDVFHDPAHRPQEKDAASSCSARSIPSQRSRSAVSELPPCSSAVKRQILVFPLRTSPTRSSSVMRFLVPCRKLYQNRRAVARRSGAISFTPFRYARRRTQARYQLRR